jgi:hypothetical protein
MIPESKLRKISRASRCAAWFPGWSAFRERVKLHKHARRWQREGWSLPLPDLLKRAILMSAARGFGARILVETGTFRGDTVWTLRDHFQRLFSIEVQPQLAALAASRFANMPHIEIIEGDSASRLADVVPRLDGPTMFWLDGHYSAGITGRGASDCPVWGELDAIVQGMKHPFLILIDDARCFGVDDGYPTLRELREFAAARFPGHAMRVENDMIWIHPATDATS